MTQTIFKRGKFELGTYWKDVLGRSWKIIQIADSELGSLFRLMSEGAYITLSEHSMKKFLKNRVV